MIRRLRVDQLLIKNNTKTMEKSIMWVAIGMIGVAFIVSMVWSEKNNLQSQNYDKCLEAMKEAIPDPNDDGRANFLRECMGNQE